MQESIYDKIERSKDVLLHTGLDYNNDGEGVLRRVMSRQMFRTNDTLIGFLDRIDAVVRELIDSVKRIKLFANPALDKNDSRIV